MAIPVIQIGQCGNQVGGSFYSTVINDHMSMSDAEKRLYSDYEAISNERFFMETADGSKKCRAIMVDMEEKAISMVQNRYRSLSYSNDFCLTGKRGCGNNWAAGYCIHGPQMESKVIELVRKLIEPCDFVDGMLMTMSLAGGTGSGIGTRLCEAIHESYPEINLMAMPIWPFRRGDVSVQSYNAVLSLSHIRNSADALLLFENDFLHDTCRRRLGNSNVTVDKLNQLIGHQLSCLLQPMKSVRSPLSDIILHTVPHPDFKLLQLRNIPYMTDRCLEFSTDQWPQLMKHLHQMFLTDTFVDEGIDWSVKLDSKRSKQLAVVLGVRGKEADTVDVKSFSESCHYAEWRKPATDCCLVWRQTRPFRLYHRSACLLTNGQNCVSSLDSSVSQAWRMFSCKAFTHQYQIHGFTETDFLDSFAAMEQLIYNYKMINK